jgi:tRNA-binding EMAP/Myf-like protein
VTDDPSSTISWDDFAKVDMRVGRVVEVEEFPGARRPATVPGRLSAGGGGG